MCFHLLGPVALGILEDIAQSRVGACGRAFGDYVEEKEAPAVARPGPVFRAREEVRAGLEGAAPRMSDGAARPRDDGACEHVAGPPRARPRDKEADMVCAGKRFTELRSWAAADKDGERRRCVAPSSRSAPPMRL